MEARCANDGTLCFAMVECDEHDLREEANTRVLKAVGAESRTSENHCPLSALQRLAHVGTERPWFTVVRKLPVCCAAFVGLRDAYIRLE